VSTVAHKPGRKSGRLKELLLGFLDVARELIDGATGE
jgi:hypothetical protein